MLIRSLAVHELAVLGAIPKAFIDACVVVIASTAVHKLSHTVGGIYAVVPVLAVEVIDSTTTHDIVGSAPAHYLILAPTAVEVVGVAPSDDIVVFRQPGDGDFVRRAHEPILPRRADERGCPRHACQGCGNKQRQGRRNQSPPYPCRHRFTSFSRGFRLPEDHLINARGQRFLALLHTARPAAAFTKHPRTPCLRSSQNFPSR